MKKTELPKPILTAPPLSKEEATTLLTLVDIALRQVGIKVMNMPGGLGVLGSACNKLQLAQEATSGNDNPKS